MAGPVTGELVASESDVTGGELHVNDAYDLSLYRLTNGDFALLLAMKVQFFFTANGLKEWNVTEKKDFIAEWDRTVRTTWDGILLRALPDGKQVFLRLDFVTQIEGFMLDHWEITVRKVPRGTDFRSEVNTFWGNVSLTQDDNKVIVRNVRAMGNFSQTTSVHEFAHMLGLDDEYGPLFGGDPGPNANDYGSLLNIGNNVRNRHKTFLILWLDKALAAYAKKSASSHSKVPTPAGAPRAAGLP
jgi:hypothetical protein